MRILSKPKLRWLISSKFQVGTLVSVLRSKGRIFSGCPAFFLGPEGPKMCCSQPDFLCVICGRGKHMTSILWWTAPSSQQNCPGWLHYNRIHGGENFAYLISPLKGSEKHIPLPSLWSRPVQWPFTMWPAWQWGCHSKIWGWTKTTSRRQSSFACHWLSAPKHHAASARSMLNPANTTETYRTNLA